MTSWSGAGRISPGNRGYRHTHPGMLGLPLRHGEPQVLEGKGRAPDVRRRMPASPEEQALLMHATQVADAVQMQHAKIKSPLP